MMEDGSLPDPFTQFYGQFIHQGNMLQDHVRTSCYQRAFLENPSDFEGKVVLDVGTGSGILAFFAIQAGAKHVYAVEASESAETARTLVQANNLSDKITVLKGRIQQIELPEKVDVIVSEPIGFLLVHERMLEVFVVARDRFLKEDGAMYPSSGSIVFAPMTDAELYSTQYNKSVFWRTTDFYGVDMSAVAERAVVEAFSQAVVGNFSSSCLLSSQRAVHMIDFLSVSTGELQNFEIFYQFQIDKTGIMHGFGCWFDIHFDGADSMVVLSTSPDHPATHWYQCRLMFKDPLAVNKGQSVSGKLKFEANEKFSFFISMEAVLDGTDISTTGYVNLHDQMYNYIQSAT